MVLISSLDVSVSLASEMGVGLRARCDFEAGNGELVRGGKEGIGTLVPCVGEISRS